MPPSLVEGGNVVPVMPGAASLEGLLLIVRQKLSSLSGEYGSQHQETDQKHNCHRHGLTDPNTVTGANGASGAGGLRAGADRHRDCERTWVECGSVWMDRIV
jgi:hypothetical protein